MHNAPGHSVGQFAIRPGAIMAAADTFVITVNGKGGHGAAPHQTLDPNLAAAHVIVALQSIASRNVDPMEQVVVSIGTLRSDSKAFNVIPQTVRMTGTVRTLNPDVQDLAEDRLVHIAKTAAATYGCTADVRYTRGVPVTVNAEEPTIEAADTAEVVAGAVERNTTPIMAGEDFSFMLNARPGAYIFIGNGEGATVHHPEYNFNDDAIPAGSSWFAEMVERRMPAA